MRLENKYETFDVFKLEVSLIYKYWRQFYVALLARYWGIEMVRVVPRWLQLWPPPCGFNSCKTQTVIVMTQHICVTHHIAKAIVHLNLMVLFDAGENFKSNSPQSFFLLQISEYLNWSISPLKSTSEASKLFFLKENLSQIIFSPYVEFVV